MRKINSETWLQITCLDWLESAYPHILFHHSPNELDMSGWKAMHAVNKAKQMGMQPGWPDLELLWKGRILFVELKSEKGRLSKTQHEIFPRIGAHHFELVVVRNLEDFQSAVEWLISDKFPTPERFTAPKPE